MTILIAGLLVFFGIHSISIVAPQWRDDMAVKLGSGWQALYSVAALVGIVLIIYGYGASRSDPVILYTPTPALRYVTALLMLFVFPLLFATYLPGLIRSTLKNPMLIATKTWAFAHLLSNGTLADFLLFGSFLIWAIFDLASVKRRAPRTKPSFPASKGNDVIAIVAGVAVFALFLHSLHYLLIGIPVIFPR